MPTCDLSSLPVIGLSNCCTMIIVQLMYPLFVDWIDYREACIWSVDYVIAINSLAIGNFEWYFKNKIFKQIFVIDGWGISCQIALIWMSMDFTDDQSTLVQVMTRCHQATSHYLSQCWPRSLSPYGVTRPQWVNSWPKIPVKWQTNHC